MVYWLMVRGSCCSGEFEEEVFQTVLLMFDTVDFDAGIDKGSQKTMKVRAVADVNLQVRLVAFQHFGRLQLPDDGGGGPRH